jgi:hypothetical protein
MQYTVDIILIYCDGLRWIILKLDDLILTFNIVDWTLTSIWSSVDTAGRSKS